MKSSSKNGWGIFIVLLLALLFALANGPLMGIPGLTIFGLADFPLSIFLPDFQGRDPLEIGAIYGFIWPLMMVGVYVAAINKSVPETWEKSPRLYKIIYMFLLTIATSIILALPFHIGAAWKSH